MTTLMQQWQDANPDCKVASISQTFTILGESFDYDELKDIAQYGANTGVSGFTYSSDLADKYDEYTTQIDNLIEELGHSLGEIFTEKGFETLQEYKEWACWVFLEIEAARITENY